MITFTCDCCAKDFKGKDYLSATVTHVLVGQIIIGGVCEPCAKDIREGKILVTFSKGSGG